jgi:hypothetical protein
MKKLLIMSIIAVFVAACSQSPEQKAEVLIKDSLKKSLYKPDTYKPVDTKVDSAFTPYDDPKVMEEVNNFMTLTKDAMSLEDDMKDNKSRMAIWSGPYMSAYSKNEYNEAKEKYESNSKAFDKQLEKIKESMQKLSSMLNGKKDFIGYKVTHNYRADNNAGSTLIGNTVFIIDKDFKEVLYSMELDEYNDMIKELIEDNTETKEE